MKHDPKVVLFFPKLEPDKPYHWFPVSSLALAAPLVAQGFQVAIIDERVEAEWEDRLKQECQGALCLGITAFTGYQLKGAVHAARLAKQAYPDLPVVWGGPHVSSLPLESIRSPLVDVCVKGYGEYTYQEVVDRLNRGDSLTGVRGITHKDRKGRIHEELDRPVKKEFDALPRAPYELIDIHKYINPETKAFIYLSSYGCPGICTFCSTPSFHCYAKINLNKICADIEYLLSRFSYETLVMFDATFFIEEERTVKIADFIREKTGLKKWLCDGRAADLVSIKESTLELLEKSNLKNIVIGLESGSPRIVKIMKKGRDHLAKFKQVLTRLSAYDINIVSGVVFGIPGETPEDLKLTLDFIKEIEALNPRFRVSSTFFMPLPGTELYNYIRQNYDIEFPTTLEGWGELGGKSHYLYNQYVDTPYISPDVKDEYFNIYDEFWKENEQLRA